MKKTVAVILLLTTVMVFFCSSNVFAARAKLYSQQTAQKTVSNVTCTLTINQYGITAESYMTGGYYNPVVIIVQLFNNNNTQALVNNLNLGVNITWQDYILSIDNQTSDLFISKYESNSFYVYPSSEFSYGNGIVVPPNESLFCVCVVDVQASFNSSTNTYTGNYVDSVGISNFTVAVSSVYPYGTPVDLSPILPYITNIDGYVEDIEGEVASIETSVNSIVSDISSVATDVDYIANHLNDYTTILQNILGTLTWSGTLPSYGDSASDSKTYTYTHSTLGITASATIVKDKSIVTNTEFEWMGGSNTYNQYLTMNTYHIYFQVTNTNDNSYELSSLKISNFITYSIVAPNQITHYSSKLFTSPRFVRDSAGNYSLYVSVSAENGANVIPKGTYDFSIDFILYSNSNSFPMINNATSSSIQIFDLANYDDEVKSQADDLITQSNNAHQQEQAFFNQNSQAIANSGLSNYQFSSDQSSGISVVTGLFNRLWNSVGSWNTVYVFSLTLAIALTIIRYTTNAIRRRSYDDNKGGKP